MIPQTQAAVSLVEQGYSVMAIDVLLTGEFTKDGAAVREAPVNDANGRSRVSAYMHGYNRPLFAKRVHDVLTAVAFVSNNPDWDTKAVHLAGIDGGGAALALAARTQCGDAVSKTMAHLGGLRLSKANSLSDPWFVPGVVKFRDLPGLIALGAPGHVLLIGEDDSDLTVARQAYLGHGAEHHFVLNAQLDLGKTLAWLNAD